MTPERWGQLEELYNAALALPPSERTALLDRADADLRATVESLLAQESVAEKRDAPREGGAFLDRPAWEGRKSLVRHDGPLRSETPVTAGERLGPYRIEQKIGQGGMGAVYRATDTRIMPVLSSNVRYRHSGRDTIDLSFQCVEVVVSQGCVSRALCGSGRGCRRVDVTEACLAVFHKAFLLEPREQDANR